MSHTVVYSSRAPEPIGPYSQAILAGNTLFASGQIAIDAASGNLVSNSIEDETRQVMSNLNEVLKAAGCTFANVVKCTIFLKDMNNFPKVNQIYGEHFTDNPPARETVEGDQGEEIASYQLSAISCQRLLTFVRAES